MELRDLGEAQVHPCYLFAALYCNMVEGDIDPGGMEQVISALALEMWHHEIMYREWLRQLEGPKPLALAQMERLFGPGSSGFATS